MPGAMQQCLFSVVPAVSHIAIECAQFVSMHCDSQEMIDAAQLEVTNMAAQLESAQQKEQAARLVKEQLESEIAQLNTEVSEASRLGPSDGAISLECPLQGRSCYKVNDIDELNTLRTEKAAEKKKTDAKDKKAKDKAERLRAEAAAESER